MIEYGIRDMEMSRRMTVTADTIDSVLEKNHEYLERFDSRGKKMKLKRGSIVHPPLERLGFSFATINFHPNTLITQSDLKQRANSAVYGKYKQIKRELARQEQLRRLNWFRSIVIAKKFAHLIVKRARTEIEAKREEEREKQEEELASRLAAQQRATRNSKKH